MKLNQLEDFQEKIENVKSVSIGKYHDLISKFIFFSVVFFFVLGMIFLMDIFFCNRVGMLAKSYEENFLLGDFGQYFVDSYMFLFDLFFSPFCLYWSNLMKNIGKDLFLRDLSFGEKLLLITDMLFIVVIVGIIVFRIILFMLFSVSA
ncbi:MAG: hypothetical protein WCX30_01605 [Candidatus Paceibacterota bacterium]|jgi:hypothetical protein|nr:hypothetical protein [bacterium]